MLVPGVSAASDDGMLVPDSAHAAAESETASVKRLRLAIVNSYGMSIMDDYYSRTIEAVKEKLTPIEIDVKIYGPDSFLKAAEKESFDMSIASSGLTSLMIERTGGLPLAAVVSDEAPDPNYANGAAIIVRADRPELRTLEDLRGRSVAIMSRTAFAGWQIPASEMVRKGLDPEAFFSEIRVSGYPMTRIVQEVKSGEVDVGFVATCLLERMARAGLQDRVEVLLCDYRDLRGEYDKLVSVEMIEAVGQRYLPAFFRTCQARLRPGGKMALQAITIQDQRYRDYSKSVDFIQRYIFPGGFLPSITAMSELMTRHTDFVVRNLFDMGPDYARTLAHWRQRFTHAWQDIEKLGFDERFRRMWLYYFGYCEAGFNARTISVVQLTAERV